MTYSIITINYNNRDGLRRTIESVIRQTFHDFEYIVIDGGSTDGSKELIEEYSNNIDYWVSEKDHGIYHAMNKGIRHAKGDYLNFMNSGDYFSSNTVLEQVLPYLTADIIEGLSYNDAQQKYEYRSDHKDSMRYLYESSLSHQASFIRRTLFDRHLYREDFRLVSDWFFFVQTLVFENCSFASTPVLVANFEGKGVSAFNPTVDIEKQQAFDELLPPRIQADYEHFKGKESPLLELIPLFNHTNRLHRIIFKMVRSVLWIYYRIFKRDIKTSIPK